MEAVQSRGGLLELSDLGSHKTRRTGSITTTYKGLHIHEIPPPTQVHRNSCTETWRSAEAEI